MKQRESRKQKKEDRQEMPAPSIDSIITISKDDGRAKVELRQEEVEERPKEEIREPQLEAKKEKTKKLKMPEPIIGTRKPKAAAVKSASKEKPKAAAVESKKSGRPKAVAAKAEAVRAPDTPKIDAPPLKPREPASVPHAPSLGSDKAALAEAALFLSPKPLMLDELAKIMGVNSLGYVKESLEKIRDHYSGRGVEVVSTSSGWQMQVKQEYLNSVAHLAPYADLSEGPKRALALILFKEPMKQSDLIKMQGNKVYDYLSELEKLGMVKREQSGRTKVLTLTKEFERYFGEEKETIRQRLGNEISIRPHELKTDSKGQLTVKEAVKKFNIDVDLNSEE